MGEIEEGRASGWDVELAYLSSGPPDGPLALCLHGFPDSPSGFERLLVRLGGSGFHAVAPFLRGYAPSDIPHTGAYQYGALVADACALHESLGGGADAVIVGHDWGAIAAYGAASFAPHRWSRVVTAAVPPLAAMASRIFEYDQAKRFWYQHFFSSPLAEATVAADDMAFFDRLWEDWSPGFEPKEALVGAKASLRDPPNLSAALDYYRSTFDASRHLPELAGQEAACLEVPSQPTLYIHGDQDGCIPVDVVDDAAAVLVSPGSRVAVVRGAGHFMQYEQPEAFEALVLEAVGASAPTGEHDQPENGSSG